MKNTIEINAQNPNRSVEGSQSIMLDVIESFTKIRNSNEIITSISVTINTIENNELDSEITEYAISNLISNKELTPFYELMKYLKDHIGDEDHAYDINFWIKASELYHKSLGYINTPDNPLVYSIDLINDYLKGNNSTYRICHKYDYRTGKTSYWVIELE